MNTPKTTPITPNMIDYVGVGPGTSIIFKSKQKEEAYYALDGIFVELNEQQLNQMNDDEVRNLVEESAMFCFID